MCRPVSQRNSLRMQAHHCYWVTAKNEESSPSASGCPRDYTSRAPHMPGSQSSSGTIAAREGKLMRAEMMDLLQSTWKGCVHRPSSLGRLKNWQVLGLKWMFRPAQLETKALLWPRRIQAARQCGTTAYVTPRARKRNERAVSSGGPIPPSLSRTRQHDVRATIPARASCAVAALESVGWHRHPGSDAAQSYNGNELWRSPR